MRRRGFTIVELLIVIVVIGILAAVSLVAYSNVQDRGRTAKITQDLASLEKAIVTARQLNDDRTLTTITGSTGTSGACAGAGADADLSDQVTYPACWSAYRASLDAISAASLVNVRNLKDPWGWPYMIDEQQGTVAGNCGSYDYVGVMQKPHLAGSWATTNIKYIPLAKTCA